VKRKSFCEYIPYFAVSIKEPAGKEDHQTSSFPAGFRILCKDQKLEIAPLVDDPKTSFNWSGPGGFHSTEARILADKEGVYSLTITDSKGCQATDEIQITVKDIDISSEFVISSQVFVNDTVVIVNISDPVPERLEWLIPESDSLRIVEKTEHLVKVLFRQTGYYVIGLRTFVDECYEDNLKSVSVMDANHQANYLSGESIVKHFGLNPNPNNGVFNVEVELTEASSIRLRIIDIGTGIVMNSQEYTGRKDYSIPYNIPLASAVYAVLLETPSAYMTIKMIIK
jgi:hypothetical protein